MSQRFIEDSFPVREVNEESSKEKNRIHGNISTLHVWWARRPLSSSRAANYAALIPCSTDEIDHVKKRNFIIELAKGDNALNENLIDKAKRDILEANNNEPPKILDPFSGGGAIPLEALRLGCKTYANDYNPVAVLIEKATLEYPQKFRNIKNKWSDNENPLIEEVKKWASWVLNETKKDIGQYYPKEKDGSIPIGFIWARTIRCQNPSCNMEIPLLRSFWLAKTKKKKIALKPFIKNENIEFQIVDQESGLLSDFDPSKGTVNKAVVECPKCKSTISPDLTRKLFKEKKSGERLIVIVTNHPKKKGKFYRIANEKDLKYFNDSKEYLEEKRDKLKDEWGIDPIPNEYLPPIGTLGFRIQRYGMIKWGDLFNHRQKLALITFIENIKKAYQLMLTQGLDDEYSKAITTYLAFSVSKIADFNSSLSRWANHMEKSVATFGRHALPMLWDYVESNQFGNSFGSWEGLCKWTIKPISTCSFINNSAIVTQTSATNLKYPDNYFDAVFTDPPYYDNVPYSYLSDFFYVWLKRILGDLYPDLFLTPLTPKKEEIVAYSHCPGGYIEGKHFFENKLQESFKEMYRILKFDGIATIVYAHKTTVGWETVINALLDSGLTVTASWPVSTERKGRLRAINSASLASSIYIVARKFKKKDLGWFKDVKNEIEEYIPQKLDNLWDEGISGADFFISAIGSAIEIFGKYKKVLDNEGNEIRAAKLLSFVRDVVADYTVRQILHNGITDELSPLTKFYLMWRWNYHEARVPFDDARKLAQSAGIDLTNEWNKGFIVKRGEFINIQGPDKREIKTLKDSKELIDVIHHLCLLWKNGKKDEIKFVLKNSGYSEGEVLYKVAQAISETLPNNNSEKKMIEGFLASRDRIMQDMRDDESQTKLI